MPQLPKVDLVVTSPPYNVGLKYVEHNDSMPPSAFKRFTAEWLRVCYDACAENARLYAVVSCDMLWWFRQPAQKAGWKFVQVIPWCKSNMGGGGARISSDWNRLTEWVLLFRKGKRTPMLNGEGTTFDYLLITSPQRSFTGELHKEHIAQFPVELPRRLISRTPGDFVLDPFCGSGSTLVAAKQLNRRCVGIDTDISSLDIAVRRLRQETLQLGSHHVKQEPEAALPIA